MGNVQRIPHFFKPKALFGLDIGNGSLKVMQTTSEPQNTGNSGNVKQIDSLIGYGSCHFNKEAIVDGVVVKPEVIAEEAKNLFGQHLNGNITTKCVAMTIPSYRTFTRSLVLPQELSPNELSEALNMEAEQYIPVSLDKLYLDYQPTRDVANGKEFLVVAVPKNIVDSYVELAAIMGLEPVLIETTMSAAVRLFSRDYQSDVPTVIVDFGSLSSDISVVDTYMLAASTVQGGGEIFTKTIEDSLKVTHEEAHIIKTRYGLSLSKRQKEVSNGLEPVLDQIIREIKRLIRYYEERYGDEHKISQLITLGGGSNIPGLNEFLTDRLRLAVRPCDPWQYLEVNNLKLPTHSDKQMYATAAGLSMVNYKEIF